MEITLIENKKGIFAALTKYRFNIIIEEVENQLQVNCFQSKDFFNYFDKYLKVLLGIKPYILKDYCLKDKQMQEIMDQKLITLETYLRNLNLEFFKKDKIRIKEILKETIGSKQKFDEWLLLFENLFEKFNESNSKRDSIWDFEDFLLQLHMKLREKNVLDSSILCVSYWILFNFYLYSFNLTFNYSIEGDQKVVVLLNKVKI